MRRSSDGSGPGSCTNGPGGRKTSPARWASVVPPSASVCGAEQRAQIPALLARGAEANGFRGDVWTASPDAHVIEQTFGVCCHRDHASRLLNKAGRSGSGRSCGPPSAMRPPSSAGPPSQKAAEEGYTIV
ncbi:MAG TPA: hypothetical protein VF040_16210 [Ktedonobacterales bacterium]